MKQIIEQLQALLSVFTRITAAVTFVCAVYISVFWGTDAQLDVRILWQILIASGLCSMCSLFLFEKEEQRSKRAQQMRIAVGFLYVNVVIFLCGFWFEWFYLSDWGMLIGMEICIIMAYAAVTAVSYFTDYKTAEEMNRKLQERNKNEDEK